MSTRGVIARKDGDGFIGRYHHWDSYPSGLGQTLYAWAHQMPRDRMLRLLLDEHPAGWSTIVGTELSLTPGYVEINDPNPECEILSTDKRPQCYCHGDRHENLNQVVTHRNAASMGCEYAYVFDDSGRTMTILSSYTNSHKMIGMFGMGDPEAVWRQIDVIDLDGAEPDWKDLNARA